MIFFTSDTHFLHHNILRYCNRPFNTIEEMDEVLIYNINHVVKSSDILYHLGDFSFGTPEQIQIIRSRILCKDIRLVVGNHDRYNKKFKKSWFKILFTKVYNEQIEIRYRKQLIRLGHYPRPNWLGRTTGTWLLHGHSHNTVPGIPGRLDVGVDANEFKPVSFINVRDRISRVVV